MAVGDLGRFDTRSERLTELYRRQIADGTLKPGDKLPSAREMSERHGVGQTTAGRVLSALKSLMLVEFRPGVGTFVIGPPTKRREDDRLELATAARATIDAYQDFRKTGDGARLQDAITELTVSLGEASDHISGR